MTLVRSATDTSVCLSIEELRTFIHDVRAPLINISGLSNELRDSLDTLLELLKAHTADLPTSVSSKASAIAEQEIGPCLHYLGVSVDQLNANIDSIVETTKNNVP